MTDIYTSTEGDIKFENTNKLYNGMTMKREN